MRDDPVSVSVVCVSGEVTTVVGSLLPEETQPGVDAVVVFSSVLDLLVVDVAVASVTELDIETEATEEVGGVFVAVVTVVVAVVAVVVVGVVAVVAVVVVSVVAAVVVGVVAAAITSFMVALLEGVVFCPMAGGTKIPSFRRKNIRYITAVTYSLILISTQSFFLEK